jgi:NADP-dependent 3-hydroxy acid dehydrogenase YdfG
LAKSGANVAILDFDIDRLQETKTECEKQGVKVCAYAVDITQNEEVIEAFKSIASDLGPVE